MGGKEALRGFLYQGFASVLEALTQEYWDKIHVEYPTENDKVDIALESSGKIVKSIQVKSSINLFSKSNIEKWIKDITSDVKALEYQIILIGSCDQGANDFINSIDKYRKGNEDKKSKNQLKDFDKNILDNNNISIKTLPIEESSLQSIVRDALNKFVSYKGYTIPFDCLELIAESTIYTQMLLGTKGNSQSKHDFDSQIFKWIELTSGEQLKSKNQLAKHTLMFYQQENKEFTNCMDEFFICEYYNYKNYINEIKEDCVNLINKISKFKLQTYEREQPKQISDTGNSLFNDSIHFKSLQLSSLVTSYAETDDNEKDYIISQIKLYFNIDIEPNFFFVGNLKEEKKMQVLGQYSYDYHGRKEEKLKNEMINDLKYNLLVYNIILKFMEKINMCSVLPIVIKNVGGVLDNNITVKLYIDKTSVKTYKVSDYPVDDYIIYTLWVFYKEKIISSIFKLRSDSNVLAETKMNFNIKQVDIRGEYKYNLDDFYNELKQYITEISHEDENYYIIDFQIKEIRASKIKFLNPLVLLYPFENDLELKYRIISDHSDGSNEGILKLSKRKLVDK